MFLFHPIHFLKFLVKSQPQRSYKKGSYKKECTQLKPKSKTKYGFYIISLPALLLKKTPHEFRLIYHMSGAHYPEPPYVLYPLVNPVPYLFIFRTVSSAGALEFPAKSILFLHITPSKKWRPKGKGGLCSFTHFPFYLYPFPILQPRETGY